LLAEANTIYNQVVELGINNIDMEKLQIVNLQVMGIFLSLFITGLHI
jgi:hypothetical protein